MGFQYDDCVDCSMLKHKVSELKDALKCADISLEGKREHIKALEQDCFDLTQKTRGQEVRIENMTKLLKRARNNYLAELFDGEHDCPTPYDIYT